MSLSIDNYAVQLEGIYGNSANSSTSKLENKLSGDFSNSTDEELMEVCKQFEAYFMEQVFKGMEKMIPKTEEEDGSMSKTVDYFKETMIQQIASDATNTQGLGLAQSLYESMERQYSI